MNKNFLLVLAFGLLTAATATHAVPVTYYASLSGPAESPPNASTGTGSAIVTIDPVAHTLLINVTFSGLLTGTMAAHIHVINGPGDLNTSDTAGPVATQTPFFLGFPIGVTAGTYSATFNTLLDSTYRAGWITDSGNSVPLAEAALFSALADGRAYFNIHTTVFPGGEIRGFLQVPEPGTLALVNLALAGVIIIRRRRQRV